MNSESTVAKTAENQVNAVERARSVRYYRPLVDIVELADELQLVVDMPGVKASEVDLRFEDGELHLHGPVQPRQTPETQCLWQEFGVGDFDRTFRVSDQIDASKIRAEHADGVLTLHLPKAEAVKPRKIAVNAG